MTAETRADGPAGARDVRAELRERVWAIDDRLFMMVEVPVQTPYTLEVLFDRLEELAAGLDRFAYVIDLTGVTRPNAPVREKLRQRVAQISPRLVHVGVVIG